MSTFWVLAAVLIIVYIYNEVKNRKLYKAALQFPGPPAIPFLGNSLDFVGNTNGIFKTLVKFSNKYDRFYRLWNNGKLFVVCKDFRDIEVALSSNVHIKKSDSYKFTLPWIGTGLLTSTGNKWRRHRKIITPTFHFKILDQFLEIFNRNGAIMCERLAENVGKGSFNVYNYVNLAALDNICETAMGINLSVQKNSETKYVRAVKDMCQVISMRFFKVWLMFDFIFNMSPYAKMQREALNLLHATTWNLIKERRKEYIKIQESQNVDDEELYGKKKLAFLDLLIRSAEGSGMSDEDIREEVDTFMFEGHDTVSSGLAFALYCLANNATVQENVYREQLEIFGDSQRMPTNRDIQQMKCLECAIKEAQRLYPSVPIIGRELFEDMQLQDGHVIPKGTQLTLMIYSLHRDPKVWPNPEEYNPDNFTPEAIQARNPYCYVPFSAGPRNCIGQKFAMLEMKSTISKVLRQYKLLPSPYEKDKIQLAAELVLISTNGYHIKIEPRLTS